MAKEYDLVERTKIFSIDILKFLSSLKSTLVSSALISQLVRSATSVGANYREANNSISDKEFKHKISICKKEIFETKYWLELLQELYPNNCAELQVLWQEAHELSLIFTKILKTAKSKG